jgi:hypothetical protein
MCWVLGRRHRSGIEGQHNMGRGAGGEKELLVSKGTYMNI